MPDPIRKLALSRFAERVLGAQPGWRAELGDPQPFGAAEMRAALRDAGADEATLKKALRQLRNRVLLRVMSRDLSGRADLAEVCGTMSDLADACIEAALAFAATPELAVAGMGKLGGRELNVSSDIDLVFVHPRGVDDDPRYEAAGRKLVRLLSEVTEDGFAFRVDMRLRPYGDSGPLACTLPFLEQYLVTQGREWERYAWLKARLISGTPSFQKEIADTVRPFVYRKYLDYGTLAAMRRLHAEVRRDVARRELAEHVKLGPGGIREIEFIVQALQLIRGGRDPDLQTRSTLEALELLFRKKILGEEAKEQLRDAYVFLRNVEHRLQYLDDAQRHDLPDGAEDRARLADMMDFASWQPFYGRLQEVRAAVSAHFDALFAEKQKPAEAWPEHARAAALRASQRYAALPADSKARLDVLVPALHRAAQATHDPDATFVRGLDLVEAIASRAAYLALLAERPEALERVTRLIASSSWAAEYITRHPLLLDELLDDRVLYAEVDFASLRKQINKELDAAQGDLERRMNVLREAHHAQVFRLLAQDLGGLLTVERLADHLSALADLILEAVLREAWRDLPRKHRDGPPAFAVVAYGKLGGKELGYASDLDVIFLFDDSHENAAETYARLAQRVVRWLDTRTASGQLFETDLQLRPSGNSGLLVSSVEAFERYQEQDAWVWEHQALTRARFCAGDAGVGAKFEGIRDRILRRSRDISSLKKEIVSMREKLHGAHPNRSELFDVKHDRGGMIDIEFAVQFLVLAHAHRHPELTRNLGNIALLGMAERFSLLKNPLGENAADAYRSYRRLQHALRLNGAQYARVPREQVQAHADSVTALWRALFPAPGA